MKYTEEFAEKVRQAYPDSAQVHGWLRSGDAMLGRMLSEAGHKSFNAKDIVSAFEAGTTEQLLSDARRAEQLKQLYREWLDCYQEQRQPSGVQVR